MWVSGSTIRRCGACGWRQWWCSCLRLHQRHVCACPCIACACRDTQRMCKLSCLLCARALHAGFWRVGARSEGPQHDCAAVGTAARGHGRAHSGARLMAAQQCYGCVLLWAVFVVCDGPCPCGCARHDGPCRCHVSSTWVPKCKSRRSKRRRRRLRLEIPHSTNRSGVAHSGVPCVAKATNHSGGMHVHNDEVLSC